MRMSSDSESSDAELDEEARAFNESLNANLETKKSTPKKSINRRKKQNTPPTSDDDEEARAFKESLNANLETKNSSPRKSTPKKKLVISKAS